MAPAPSTSAQRLGPCEHGTTLKREDKTCYVGCLTAGRKSHEVHERVFGWVLALIAERGLVRGERIGVDASTLEANAALRAIVRRDAGEGYREMLTRMAQESGIETPTVEDLIRLDRNRTGKRLSNEEWVSAGQTHEAYLSLRSVNNLL